MDVNNLPLRGRCQGKPQKDRQPLRYAEQRTPMISEAQPRPPRHRPHRRAGIAVLTVAATMVLCFALGQFTPGDAFSALELDPAIPPAALAHLRQLYLPQHSLGERLGAWVVQAAHGDLGYSLQFHRPVAALVRERAPASLELMVLGLGLAWVAGLLLALIPAWMGENARRRAQRGLEVTLHAGAALLTALPLGVLAVGALVLAPPEWLPMAGSGSPWLPAAVLALAFLPTVYFQTAHALAAVLDRPFIWQGRAAGFGPARVLLVHALPNISDILVPVAALTVSQAMVELVILEPLLGWPGLGQLSIQAAQNKDMPVLSALVLFSSLVVIASNWISEAVQTRLNPVLRDARWRESAKRRAAVEA